MGIEVLRATSSDPLLRAYAHCSAHQYGAGISILLINLAPQTALTTTLQGVPVVTNITEWHLTSVAPASSQMALNGKLLQGHVVDDGAVYKLPPLVGRTTARKVGESLRVELAPASIAFVHLHTDAVLALCTA